MRNRCAIPQENNPAADETGKNCDQKQSGSVWFLASTKGCTAEWEWYDICRKECSLDPYQRKVLLCRISKP
jgi:hypothetical protein